MSEFTSIGEVSEMVLRQLARNRAAHFDKLAKDAMRRLLISKDPIFLRRFVEASTLADEAIVTPARQGRAADAA